MTKAVKLLELAARSSTPEAERLAALDAIARLADKAGGVDRLFVGDQHGNPLLWVVKNANMRNFELSNEVQRLKGMLEVAKNNLLPRLLANPHEPEREAIAKSLDPEVALYGSLGWEWRTVRQIYLDCYTVGFMGAESTIRRRLIKLEEHGSIEWCAINSVTHYRKARKKTFPD